MHAAAGIVILGASTLVLFAAVAGRDRWRPRLTLTAAALGVRLVAGATAWTGLAVTGRAWLSPDEGTYLAEAHRVEHGAGLGPHAYSNFLGLLFKVTGPSAWLPRCLNVLAGAAVVALVYEVVRLVAGRRAAVWAGAGVALWPSLVLWSLLVLKDSFVLVAVFGALLGGLYAFRGRWWGAALALGACASLELLRPYAFVVVGISLAVGVAGALVRRRARRLVVPAVLVVTVGLVGLVGGRGFLGIGFAHSQADVESVAFARTEGSAGHTGFASPHPRSVGDVVRGIPRGLLYSMLGPFPWDAGDVEARALLVVELPAWYAALAFALAGLRHVRPRDELPEWATLFAFVAGLAAVLAIYEGNAGTAIRQRSPLVPIVLLLAAMASARRRDAIDALVG